MRTLCVGPDLVEFIVLCLMAGKAILIVGRHGVGKSAVFHQVAVQLRIGLVVRDLSLMEPLDLVGLPHKGKDRKTRYCPPAFLPRRGAGLMLFEELNRAARYVLAPCLELLSSGRLNDYRLPRRWLPCAAINPPEDGYHVDRLDEAMLSRFIRVQVVPDADEWLAWARGPGKIHPLVAEFVDCSPSIFDDPAANPRAWEQVSRILRASERGVFRAAIRDAAVSGAVGEKWTAAFVSFLASAERPLRPEGIIEQYPTHAPALRRWVSEGRLDLVVASVYRLKRFLGRKGVVDGASSETRLRANLEGFLRDLPPDLGTQLSAWCRERGLPGIEA